MLDKLLASLRDKCPLLEWTARRDGNHEYMVRSHVVFGGKDLYTSCIIRKEHLEVDGFLDDFVYRIANQYAKAIVEWRPS